MIEEEIAQKVAYLESLGLAIDDYNPHNPTGEATITFSSVEGYWEIEVDSFTTTSTLEEILQEAIEYSICCGALLTEKRSCLNCQKTYQ